MERYSQRIGMGIDNLIKEKNVNVADFASRIGYSIKDVYRLIEGKLMLAPKELEKVVTALGGSLEGIINSEPAEKAMVPELEYDKSFSSSDNLYKIIGYMDDYIELVEKSDV